MIHQADGIVGYHTHPHVDFLDTGIRAMRLLVRTMQGEVKPVMVQRKLSMITSAEKHNTNHGPMSEVMHRILEIERSPGVLAATIFATQPWMDVSQLGWSTVVVTDGDEILARKLADGIAFLAWERREQFLVKKTPVREAVDYAQNNDGKPFVLADSSDSVTGGAHGDGNILLRELLATDFKDTALMTLTDPEAVAACFDAGVSGQVSIAVGGKLTPRFYSPVLVTGHVKTLTDGKYMGELPSRPANIGRTAVLRVNGIHILLSENPAGTIDAAAYLTAGLDPKDFKIVQVKSPGGFRAIYEPFAAGVFEIDTPGPTDSELTRLPFKNITRPLWPFDPELNKPWN
jgi:microcystin degradation protein MlrC